MATKFMTRYVVPFILLGAFLEKTGVFQPGANTPPYDIFRYAATFRLFSLGQDERHQDIEVTYLRFPHRESHFPEQLQNY